jgi:hypothetical protein
LRTKTRRRTHVALAIIFAVQVPVAIAAQLLWPAVFEQLWKQYLVFLSLYAIVSTHWAGASAETPTDED